MLKPQRITKLENQSALTALLSTILLLAIAVSLVTVIYTVVLNNTTSQTEDLVSSVNLVGSIVQDKNISFANRGGDTLAPDVRITITINQNTYTFTIGELNGNHGLAPGETIHIHISDYSSLSGLQVKYTVLDPEHNMLVSQGILQEGEQGITPYVQTLGASLVTSHSARLTLAYNFINASIGHPKVRIQIKTDSTTSQYNSSFPPWYNVVSPLPEGTYSYDIHDLLAGQKYVCRAQLTFDGLSSPKLGLGLSFTTPTDKISEWNFDSTSGPVIDSASTNTGILKPDDKKGPRYEAGYVANGLNLDGIDDRVNISDAASLHLTDEMTIETWVKPLANSNGSFGNITSLATTQFADTTYGTFEPDWISLGGQYYAIVSRSSAGKGFIATVKITNAGSILANGSTCLISKYTINASCATPKIIPVNGAANTYAVVYTCNNYGYIMTIKINGTGIIQPPLKYYKFSGATYCYHPDIAYVAGNTYTVVFGSSTTKTSSYGYIQNIFINASGASIANCGSLYALIHDAIPAALAGQPVLLQEPEILELQEGSFFHFFAIVYRCRDDDGGVCTVKINPANGAVTLKNGERKFDSKRAENPEIFFLKNQYYGIIYGCEGSVTVYNDDLNHLRGFLTIIKINEITGAIPNSGETANTYVAGGEYQINQPEYAYSYYTFRSGQVMYLSDNGFNYYYAFSYTLYVNTSYTRGFVKTYKITPGSPTTIVGISGTRYDQVNVPDLPDIMHLGFGTKYGLIYRQGTSAANNNGLIKTLTINDTGTMPTNPIIDSREIGIPSCTRTRGLRITDTISAILYQGASNNAYIKTANISALTINPNFVSSYTIEPGISAASNPNSSCYEPYLFPLTGNYYAVVYRNYTNRLIVSVFKITATGLITFMYTQPIGAIVGYQPAVVKVEEYADIYMIGYRNVGGQGRLTTAQITSGLCTVKTTTILDASACNEPIMYKVGSGNYVVAYDGASSKGVLKTFKVLSGGNNITFVDLYNFTDTVRTCNHPDIAPVNQTIFAVAYSRKEGAKYSSVIMTVIIRQNGSIRKFNLDNITFNYPTTTSLQSTIVTNPFLIRANGRIFAVTYKNNNNGNGLSTLRIGENGNITEIVDMTLSVGGDTGDIPIMAQTSNRYLMAYGSGGVYARLVRIFVNPKERMIFAKTGSYELSANGTTVWVKITDVSASHRIQAPLSYPNGWNYIVVIYKQGKYLNLTINANDPGSSGHLTSMANSTINYLKAIKVGVTTLSFGDYNGLYDEFTLWASAFAPSRIVSRFISPNS